ncbi:arginine decarboxylase [Anaeromicropila herbilytica]|uniref:Arginine decarboxylase n=2 Tax=Anaeromicropila herbilytica TaxID=2785025 RepID=A0A7R7EHV3_9FIRM|nr:arginine decarboxylase [Anaeromicropila herbilytica]
MHMPGHKRNTNIMSMINPYEIDITEIDGFDNLHDANDVLKKAMERAAHLYHSEHTHFLVNGSTVGILSGISAVVNRGDTVIVARNCHKAVYHAIYLNDLKPVYIYPQIEQNYDINGGISPEKVEEMLINNPNTKLVILTSPTYEGIVSNVKKIAKICHRFHVPLMIDEAHGAHFGFSKDFPVTSIESGADLVIHSVHKTLPSFTQTALLHVNGKFVDNERVKKMLSIYESSSPSYILMASIDLCIELLENRGEELFTQYKKNLDTFKMGLELKHLTILDESVKNQSDVYAIDESKIVISTKNSNITGKMLYDKLLNKYKIQLEMASMNYVIAMTSICDSKEGFERLRSALIEIDFEIDDNYRIQDRTSNSNSITITTQKYTIYEASHKESEDILLSKANGRICGEYVYVYPPGIPLIVPGEEISNDFIEKLIEYKQSGLDVKGLKGVNEEFIIVLREERTK